VYALTGVGARLASLGVAIAVVAGPVFASAQATPARALSTAYDAFKHGLGHDSAELFDSVEGWVGVR